MRRILLALALTAGALAAQSTSPEELLRKAIAAHQAGDMDTAIRGYQEVLQFDPNSVPVRSNLGAALARAGRYEEAIDQYNRALSAGTRNPSVVLNLGLAYYKINRIPEAAKCFEEVRKSTPDNRQVTLLLANCHLRQGENAQVIELLAPLEKENAADGAFNYLFGMALIRDRQTDRGSAVIDRILRNGDSAEARLLIGTTKLFANDYNGALPELRKAVELDPKLTDAHAYYGQALLGTGDQAGAGDQFLKELELNPTNFLANLELGVLAKQDQNLAKSRSYFERALASRPGDPGVRYQLATIDLAAGQVDQARGTLEQLLAESPQFTEAHVTLATVYYRLKRKQDGDRERAAAQKLIAQQQAKQPGAAAK